jgi:hypothetical protein
MQMFKSLLKAATAVVTVPAAVVADVITVGGAMVDADEPYTVKALGDFMQNLEDASKPEPETPEKP